MGYCARHISTYAYSWFPLFDPSGNTVTLTRFNVTAGKTCSLEPFLRLKVLGREI